MYHKTYLKICFMIHACFFPLSEKYESGKGRSGRQCVLRNAAFSPRSLTGDVAGIMTRNSGPSSGGGIAGREVLMDTEGMADTGGMACIPGGNSPRPIFSLFFWRCWRVSPRMATN